MALDDNANFSSFLFSLLALFRVLMLDNWWVAGHGRPYGWGGVVNHGCKGQPLVELSPWVDQEGLRWSNIWWTNPTGGWGRMEAAERAPWAGFVAGGVRQDRARGQHALSSRRAPDMHPKIS